ncbi:MAG: hypothetical protein JST00_29195 [Deltaproteobacteria bacterium]|nr:hypothetical protein [Deltaproteobacteria bacterium]
MRFLYGDSAPFPLGYNFLATLEIFMTTATRIVQLEQETRESARTVEETAQARVKGLEALEQFHTVVMRAVQDTAQKVQHAHALDYAARVAEFASGYVDNHRRAAVGANERESVQARAESEKRMTEQRQQLEVFLKAARLPVGATKFSLRLAGEGKDVRHHVSAVFDNPDGIQTVFKLDAARVPAWAMPRKVSEFAQGVDLMVGIDKSWLRGTVSAKQVNVDEWIVTQAEMSDDSFELVLRKRMTEKEVLHFKMVRGEGGLRGIVEHPGLPGAEQVDGSLGPADVVALDRVWQALRLAMRELVEHKEQLVNVTLDGQPVFDGGLVIPFVIRLVAMFAPTVREIAKRSPNEHELSLKQETDGGRREEVYLRKEQLVSRLQPLSSTGREVFAPLGLDGWVPGVTNAPPPVAAGPVSAIPPASGSNRVLPQS